MCNETCPLESLCKKRVSVAEYILQKQHNDVVSRIDSESSQDIQSGYDHIGDFNLDASVQLVRDASTNVLLASAIQSEVLTQITEKLHCPGPTIERRFKRLGRVISVECGSEPRKDRLKDHLNENFNTDQQAVE